MAKAIGPGVRGARPAGKSFVAGAYAEELRAMEQRRRDFTDWCRPYDAILLPTMAVPAIPLVEVDETLADPRLPHAAGQLSRPVRLAMPAASPAACRSASRSSASRIAERDVLRARQGLPGRDRLPPPRARSFELGL